MKIDLNKKIITKEGLLRKITDIDIYRHYIGKNVELGVKLKSFLRDEDDPSFGFFIGDSGEICFNDFLLGGGDCVKFVQLKFGLNFHEALSKIAIDLKLDHLFIVKKTFKTESSYNPDTFEDRDKILSKANNFKLGKKSREWEARDLAYWLKFGIDHETLIKYNVEPISYIFINQKPILAEKFAYAFTEFKDNVETYKIYQPYSERYKWINNHNHSIWQGWNQLPGIGKTLIITKSLKDVMAISNILGIPSVSLQSESTFPKAHIIDELKERFKQIFILYDNDYDKEENWGRQLGNDISEAFYIPQIEIDEKYKAKDFSDLVAKFGAYRAKIILDGILEQRITPF